MPGAWASEASERLVSPPPPRKSQARPTAAAPSSAAPVTATRRRDELGAFGVSAIP
jgi:hypothetical protein